MNIAGQQSVPTLGINSNNHRRRHRMQSAVLHGIYADSGSFTLARATKGLLPLRYRNIFPPYVRPLAIDLASTSGRFAGSSPRATGEK